MPNEKVLSEKKAIVEALTERLKSASAGVFVDYKGITVSQDNEIRRQLSTNAIEYSVIKNTLSRFAIDNVGLNDLEPILNGTTSLATSTADPIVPFRLISEYSKKLNGTFTIKAGFMEGRILSNAEIEEISQLTSKSSLHSKVLGTMLAPITSLAVVLGQILAQKGGGESAEPAAAAE
jgi:large subunit ribosomal protein L10